MLRAEAAWLARRLAELPTDGLSPLLSIGSGGAELRATQPWIDRAIYEPLVARGVRVLHHELAPAEGVDVAGDLTDPEFRAALAALELRSVMCCNVLEHVPDAAEVAATIERLVAPSGHALVTVPHRFPYHPGPIDTLLRPSPEELSALFPALTPLTAAEIRCESLLGYWLASPTKWSSLTRGVRTAGTGPPGPPAPLRETLRMAFVSTAVSAVVLRATP